MSKTVYKIDMHKQVHNISASLSTQITYFRVYVCMNHHEVFEFLRNAKNMSVQTADMILNPGKEK